MHVEKNILVNGLEMAEVIETALSSFSLTLVTASICVAYGSAANAEGRSRSRIPVSNFCCRGFVATIAAIFSRRLAIKVSFAIVGERQTAQVFSNKIYLTAPLNSLAGFRGSVRVSLGCSKG